MLTKRHQNHGFTLVEVAIVTPMVILVVLGILALLITLVRNNAVQDVRSSTVVQARTALTTLERDVDTSTTFLPSTLPANFTDFNPPGNTGTYNTSFGTLPSRTSSTNLNDLFIEGANEMPDCQINLTCTQTTNAIKGTPTCSGATITNSANIVPLAIIYFVNNGTLYRRTIIDNTNPTTCGTLLVHQSCPTGSDAHVPACTVNDTALLNNVTQFQVAYYFNPGDASAMNAYVASPSPTIDNAATIGVTIGTTANASGSSVTTSISMRMTRANY